MLNKNTAISLKNLSKEYNLERSSGFLWKNKFKKHKVLKALNNINLDIKKGDNIGIIGANGSGKSTLLKTIAGITRPTKGTIEISGNVVSIMKLEAGFNPELSGLENIYINSFLVGMTKEEIKAKTKKIISFSGVGNFINLPLYTYSDGMKFRLALAIAFASNCDILLIDEVLVSGDIKFQKKIIETITRFQKTKLITTIITSHIPAFVWAFSNKFYELKKGRLKKIPIKKMVNLTKRTDETWRENIFKGIE